MSASSDVFTLLLATLIAGFATWLTRSGAYFLFRNRSQSPILSYLERSSGLVIMVILVFYSIAGVEFTAFPYGAAHIAGIACALIFQLITRNALVSIIGATAIFMIISKFI